MPLLPVLNGCKAAQNACSNHTEHDVLSTFGTVRQITPKSLCIFRDELARRDGDRQVLVPLSIFELSVHSPPTLIRFQPTQLEFERQEPPQS